MQAGSVQVLLCAPGDGGAYLGNDVGGRLVELGEQIVDLRSTHRVDFEPSLLGFGDELRINYGVVERLA